MFDTFRLTIPVGAIVNLGDHPCRRTIIRVISGGQVYLSDEQSTSVAAIAKGFVVGSVDIVLTEINNTDAVYASTSINDASAVIQVIVER